MDILHRIARLVRVTAENNLDELEKIINSGRSYLDSRLDEWEERLNLNQETKEQKKEHTTSEGDSKQKQRFPGFSPQVIEDLEVFGLTPPSSLEEVKRIRNQEIKKYHSDLFMHDKEKQETAKQIMQIYNSAYERLKKYYG